MGVRKQPKEADAEPNQDAPQTPKRASSRIKSDRGFPLSEVNTPLSSPYDKSRDVFSPSESIASDITDDYGWDSPIKQRGQTRPRSFSMTSLSNEDEEEIWSQVDDESSNSFDTLADLSAQGSRPPSETTETTETNAPIKQENDDEGDPGSTKIRDQRSVTGSIKGTIALHDSDPGRRISFTLNIDLNLRTQEPRPKSDIHLASRESTTASDIPPISVPGIQLTPPDSPADNTPYISSQKAEDSQVVISLANILPFSIRQFIARDGKHCVAIAKQKNARCRGRRNLDVEAISKALDSLPPCNSAGIKPVLQDLFTMTLCGPHQKMAKAILIEWFGDNPRTHPAEHLAAFGEWIHALQGSTSGEHKSTDASSTDSTENMSKPIQPFALLDPTGPTTPASSEPMFDPYRVKCHANKSVSRRLYETLTECLTKKEIDPGFIYIFGHQNAPGHLKIGVSKNKEERLSQWGQCMGPVDEHFPLEDDDDNLPVQHVYRVEKLIQAEFKDQRVTTKCPKCKATHREWFYVSKDSAVHVIRKWMRWIRKKPYIRRTLADGTTVWELNDLQRKWLDDLYTPSEILQCPSTTHKKPRSASQSNLCTPTFAESKRRASVSL
ncbi:T5orf172 domain-containing protein [Aspergillus varians]